MNDLFPSYVPYYCQGRADRLIQDPEVQYWYPWLQDLQGTNTFAHLSAVFPDEPPPGFNYYILNGNVGMTGWAEQIYDRVRRPIFVLSLPEVNGYPCDHPDIHYVPYTHYHLLARRLQDYLPDHDFTAEKKIQYKASALTRRLTEIKIVIFTAMMRYLDPNDRVVSLYDDLELKNVHGWEPTGDAVIDDLVQEFRDRWLGKTMTIDLDQVTMFNQDSVLHAGYLNSALNFTQESFHYSFMYDQGREYIAPGPFLTEKTFKSVLTCTAFIPAGQYHSYHWLERMGMQFDYGDLDLSFDLDPGNNSRMCRLVDLIRSLDQWSAQDIYAMTRNSTLHNRELVISGDFGQACERFNRSNLAPMISAITG